MTLKRLAIVAGAGDYPRLMAEGARLAGVAQIDMVALRGSTARATVRAATRVHWITLGGIADGIRWLGAQDYDGVCLAGQVNPLSLFRGRFDPEVRAWLDELPVKTAHSIFGKLIEKMSDAGIRTLPASFYMEGHLPLAGVLGARAPSALEAQDLAHAAAVARDTGVHDVGQTVMVKRGMVLAVEAFEGTNAAIRRGGRLGGPGAVVFKAARAGHDMRFDIPVVGLKTLKVMHRAGATALGYQAGRLILVERQAVVDYADRHGIALVGIESGLPHAPVRPD